jgi:hypothetical protein
MQGDLILVERKTYRGRIGSIGPEGLEWTPDIGRRHEEGHVLVCHIAPEKFRVHALLKHLKAADTWKQPGWIQKIEDDERRAKEHRKFSRSSDMKYKAGEVFDRYVWQNKQRVFGGI